MHRSSGIYLTAEGNPGKPQLGDRLMKAVLPALLGLSLKQQLDRRGCKLAFTPSSNYYSIFFCMQKFLFFLSFFLSCKHRSLANKKSYVMAEFPVPEQTPATRLSVPSFL